MKAEVFTILKKLYQLIFLLIINCFLIPIFFLPSIQNAESSYNYLTVDSSIQLNPNGFIWPIPGYTAISSPFGKRKAPTGGASSFHYGCDIPAPAGTRLYAIADGEITFRKFLGAGGYTITLSFSNFKVSYCHVDPNYIVSVGDKIKQGQLIGVVGPKIVYGVPR